MGNTDNKSTMNATMLRLSGTVATVMITIIISMTSFWMMIGRNFTTRNEVNTMMENRVHIVEQQIEQSAASNIKVQGVIEKNTEAIQGLHVQIAILNKTLELLEKQRND
jgi:hypothetical protein